MAVEGMVPAGRMGGAIVAALLVAGCLRHERAIQADFVAADHTAWMAKGTASIDGEGFIRRPNGFLARCSGNEVMLAPASPYFREWVGLLKTGATPENRAELAARHQAAVRKTQCDATGRFSFTDLPAGKWFVSTRISYQSPRDSFSENALYVTEIETRPGEVVKAILANPNRI